MQQRPAADHWRKILLVYILQLFPCKWRPHALTRALPLALLSSLCDNTHIDNHSPLRAYIPPSLGVYPLFLSFVSLCLSRTRCYKGWSHCNRAKFVGKCRSSSGVNYVVRPGPRSKATPFIWDHVSSVDLPIDFISWMKILLDAIFLRPFLFLALSVLVI